MTTYRYSFNNPRTGQRCCANDDPDPKYFCDACKEQLQAVTHPAAADPYAAALSSYANERRDALSPDADPHYDPYGQPPDGYAMHLALRQLERQEGR